MPAGLLKRALVPVPSTKPPVLLPAMVTTYVADTNAASPHALAALPDVRLPAQELQLVLPSAPAYVPVPHAVQLLAPVTLE